MTAAPQLPPDTDEGVVHAPRPKFGKVPERLMHDPLLTDGAIRLYAHMHWRYGKNQRNFEGRESMAAFLGVSESTISNRVAELEAADWIAVIPRADFGTGRKTNIYHIFIKQDECKKWRDETDHPKPKIEEVKTRKSRKGIGGQPSHKMNSSSLMDVNLSSPTQINSSSHELDSVNYIDSQYPDSLFAEHAIAVPQNGDPFGLDEPVNSKELNKFLEKKTNAATERLSEVIPTSKKDPEPTKTTEQELPKESSAKERVSPVLAQVIGVTDPVIKESPSDHNSVSFTALTLHDCELAGELRFKAKADVWVEWGNWGDEVHLSEREPARLAFFKGWDKSREGWNKARFEEIGKAPVQPDLPQPIPFLPIPPIAPDPPVEALRSTGADKFNELRAVLYYAVNHDLKQVALSPAEQYVQNLMTPGWVHVMGIVIKTSEQFREYAVIPEYPSVQNAPSLNGQGPRTDDLPLPRPTTPETQTGPSGAVFPLPVFANLAWYTCAGENTLVHLAKPTPSGQRLKPICGVKGHAATPVETASRGNRQPCPDCQRLAAERAAPKVKAKAYSDPRLFDAVVDVCWNTKDADSDDKEDLAGGRPGAIRKWLVERAIRKQKVEDLSEEAIVALATHIHAFGKWYDETCKGCKRPRDLAKFKEHWIEYTQSARAKSNPQKARFDSRSGKWVLPGGAVDGTSTGIS